MTLYRSFVYTCLYLALIAVGETIIVTVLLDLPLSLAPATIGLIVFSVYVNDQLIDLDDGDIPDPGEAAFIARHKDLLYVFGAVSYGIALSLSVWGGLLTFAIALIPGLAWILYASDVISTFTERTGVNFRRLKELFLLNSLLVAFAWAITLVLIPVGYAGQVPVAGVLTMVGYFLLRVFKNTEVSNVADRAEDEARDISTLPTVLGVRRTQWAFHAIDALTAVVLVVAVAQGYLPETLSLALFVGLAYSTVVVRLVDRFRNADVLSRLAEYEYLVVFGTLIVLYFRTAPSIDISFEQVMPVTIAVALMVAIGIGISASLLAWREYPEPGALPLILLLAGQTWWSATLFLEFQATTFGAKLLIANVRWVGIVLIPLGWLLFSLEYTGLNRYLQPRYILGLSVIPAMTVFLALTDDYNSLLYQGSVVVERNGLSYLARESGPWFWVIAAYTYLLGLLGAIPLLELIRSDNLLFRGQSIALLVGIAAPWIANVLFLVGWVPVTGFDPTPIAFGVSGVAYLGALTRFQLLGSSPTPSRSARRVAYERMRQGAIVVDRSGFVIDINPKAAEMFDTTVGETLGRPASEVIPHYEELPAHDTDSALIEDERRNRSYEATVSELTDPYRRTTGRIITLNDVTDILKQEQRISVLNRILRHNVRNELNIVDGRLELARELVDDEVGHHLETARESAHRIIDAADQARRIEQMFRESESTVAVPLVATVERVVETGRATFPEAEIDLTVSTAVGDVAAVSVVDRELFGQSLSELIENSVVHSDRDAPSVTVEVGVDGDRAYVRVVDDGPGIPTLEQDVLNGRTETALEHSRGLGLWLAQWTISLSGGSLEIGQREPCGSVVTLRVPLDRGESGTDTGA
ncbi:histidine kinase N-terminal 7TM domain-containing protein [Natronomonas sp. EA1]|uniref:histidine kinase N-terminal 7TM domain-containing protein n=1 Tax=Natronomonas sp. EA1 TaxID=3421655 RepID=UPI003EBEB28F